MLIVEKNKEFTEFGFAVSPYHECDFHNGTKLLVFGCFSEDVFLVLFSVYFRHFVKLFEASRVMPCSR